jgi:hypothetical protein
MDTAGILHRLTACVASPGIISRCKRAGKAVCGCGRDAPVILQSPQYGKIPYSVAFILIEEGPFLMSTVADVPKGAFRCEMPSEVVFEDATANIAVPKFRPVK